MSTFSIFIFFIDMHFINTIAISVFAASSFVFADNYPKSPCNAVHWTRMLEGKLIVEGKDKKPISLEDPSFFEHDLPYNHRIIHAYDDIDLGRNTERLTIYVDRENIFLNAFCA